MYSIYRILVESRRFPYTLTVLRHYNCDHSYAQGGLVESETLILASGGVVSDDKIQY